MSPPTGTAAGEAEEYLAGIFETCTGFELAVVTSVEPRSRQLLRERLEADGAELRVLAPTVEAIVAAPRVDASLAGHRSLVLWFEAPDDDEAEWRAFAVALNRAREQLRAQHGYLWVLAGPLSLRRIMTVHAQDIYSVAYKAPHITARAGAQIDWLHLSDLQLRRDGDSRQREAFLSDLRRTIEREDVSIDLVLVSGDLAAQGEADEYAQVDRLLDALGEMLVRHGGAAPIVFAVPGNHDVLRRNARTLRRYDSADPHIEELRQLLWVERDTSFVEPLFHDYLEWARRRVWAQAVDRAGMMPGVCYLRDRSESYFPGDGSVVVEKDDLRVVVVGLNTAWTSFRGKDTGELAIEQFDAAISGLEVPLVTHAGVLLTHHGLDALSSEAREYLADPRLRDAGIGVHLHGHLYNPQETGLVTTDDRLRVAGVPLFGARAPRAYALGRLQHDGRVQVWCRSMSAGEDEPTPHFVFGLGAVLEQAGAPESSASELVSADEIARYLSQSRYVGPREAKDVIELRLSTQPIEHAPPWGAQETFPAMQLFVRARERGARAIVLRGAKGSGRTTLIGSLAKLLEREGPVALGLPAGTVPVFLTLEQLTGPEITLVDLIELKAHNLAPDFARRLCERGRLLLVFDGLSQLEAEPRASIGARLESLLAPLRESHLLVTDATNLGLPDGWFELHLCPFDDEQVARYLRENDEEVDGHGSEALVEWLFDPRRGPHERILELARHPASARWVAISVHAKYDLRDQWSEFIGMCAMALWRSRPDNSHALDDALDDLAAQIHEIRGRRWIPETDISVAYEGLQVDGTWLLDQLLAHGDHLVRRKAEVGFAHLAVQEYLTVRRWRDRVRDDDGAWARLAARFDDDWWHQVIAMMLDRPHAFAPFMDALVRRPEFPEWAQTAMMQRCLTTAAEPSPTPFVEVIRRIDAFGVAHQIAAANILRQFFPNDLEAALPSQLTLAFQQQQQLPPPRIEAHGGIELIHIPGGRARFGSPLSEPGHHVDEAPLHEVELDDFYMARTPVTNADYARYLRCNPDAPIPRYWTDRRFNQPEQPVVGVSWAEAQAYCDWAGLALPTEAQWEYACRAGARTRFSTGDDESSLARAGWYAANSAGKLQTVRTREPNALGLFDMHGNVREWCGDDYGSYEQSPRPGDGLRHPPSDDGSRVHRGGCFRDAAEDLRCASRHQALAGYRLDTLGFRPVASVGRHHRSDGSRGD